MGYALVNLSTQDREVPNPRNNLDLQVQAQRRRKPPHIALCPPGKALTWQTRCPTPPPHPFGMTSLPSCFPGILKPEIIFPTSTPGIFYIVFWLLSVPLAKQREIQPERLEAGMADGGKGGGTGTLCSPLTFPKLAYFTSISASSITTTFQVIFCGGISGGEALSILYTIPLQSQFFHHQAFSALK